jgi:hypothetical protein
MRTRIFLSWCHQDKAPKVALLRDLLPPWASSPTSTSNDGRTAT